MFASENAHALVIGISAYQHIWPLPPVRDADEIARVLADEQRCGYPAANVCLLKDAAATREAIRAGLDRLLAAADPDSTAFLYFSGHGGRVEQGPAAGQYLLPVDTVYPPEEALANTAIAGSELTTFLRALKARQVVVVLDCCHAGGIGQPRDLVPVGDGFRVGFPDGFYKALATGAGRAIFASSRDDEPSHVLDGAEFGLFTKHLLDGLKGGVASDDGLVRVFDLFEYVQPRVTAEHPRQHPVFKCEVESNFPVGRYQGGKVGQVAQDAEGFRYDAYVSYAAEDPDAAWVVQELVPRAQRAGLRVAVSEDSWEPGVARVASIARGIRQAKRTVVVLSPAFLKEIVGPFEAILAATLGLDEGSYRLLPVRLAPVGPEALPLWLSALSAVDFTSPGKVERSFERLIKALQGPLPKREDFV
jgi:hypothetical protein